MAILVKGPVAVDIEFMFMYTEELTGEFTIPKECESLEVSLNDEFDIIASLADDLENNDVIEGCMIRSWYAVPRGITYRFKAKRMSKVRRTV